MKIFKNPITKDFLVEKYNKNKLSPKEIAKLVPCDYTTILTYLKKYNIPKEINNNVKLKDPQMVTYDQIIGTYKYHAKERKISWDLTKEEAIEIFNNNCYYCNSVPFNKRNFYRRKRDGMYSSKNIEWVKKAEVCVNGIDRLDNDRGYTKENSVPCCYNCNAAKGEVSYKEFLIWLDKIILNRKNLKDA